MRSRDHLRERFLGAGTGSFGPGTVFDLEGPDSIDDAAGLAAGDFDGDGHADLAGTNQTSNDVSSF